MIKPADVVFPSIEWCVLDTTITTGAWLQSLKTVFDVSICIMWLIQGYNNRILESGWGSRIVDCGLKVGKKNGNWWLKSESWGILTCSQNSVMSHILKGKI